MPVTIEIFRTENDLSEQNRIDLGKVYKDADPQLLSIQLPEWENDNWLERLFSRGMCIVGARFNARLLGAAMLSQQTPPQLQAICVRHVTRRRGVGVRMLELLLEQYPELIISSGSEQLDTMMQRLELQPVANSHGCWQK